MQIASENFIYIPPEEKWGQRNPTYETFVGAFLERISFTLLPPNWS